MSDRTVFYAVSPAHSGVSWFPTEAARDEYVIRYRGEAIDPEQVDPEIRREAEGS